MWQLPVPHLPLPRVGLPRVPTPPVTGVPGRVLWWGGLAAVAAVGVVDWPVAAAIAAGSYVAERRARAARRESPAAPTAPTSPSTPTSPTGGDEEEE
ncbi:MAG TPA: hypothetical protein VKP64_04085 [Mycobacteriales bacterium]|nr:hypothetical protein [Mycobacteriales bacterium]